MDPSRIKDVDGSAECGNSSKNQIDSILSPIHQAASMFPVVTVGSFKPRSGRSIKGNHARFSDWHIKSSLSRASALRFPSRSTNLVASGGSSLIHGSESVLNQPLIKREHAKVSSNILI